MAAFAFLTAPLHGHLNPTLAVAADLVARGHDVRYYLPDEHRDAVEATGATLRPFVLSERRRWLDTSPQERFVLVPIWLAAESIDVMPQILDDLRAQPPDVIVYDVLCIWGRIAAELLERPAAKLCTTYAMNDTYSVFATPQYQALPRSPESVDLFLSSLQELHSRYGVALDVRRIFMHSEALTIAFLPRAFQPCSETFDDRYVFVGPSISERGRTRDPFVESLPERATAYVSMGTVFNDWPELPALCASAFYDDRWQVVVSTGDRSSSGDPLGNVIARPSVSQLELLRRVKVFVTHGGMGSVMEALACGVPLVVIPQVPEQAITAQRVADLGLGETLDRSATTASSLRDVVERVATSPQIRQTVNAMQQVALSAGGSSAAARAIEQLANPAHRAGAEPR